MQEPQSAPASHYERERRQKLQQLRDLGVDPFGGRVEGLTPLAQVRSGHKPEFGQDGGPVFKVAGRVMLKRDMGKLSFITIRDETGDLQVALDKRRLDDTAWQVRDLIDLGDQIVAGGPLGATKTGEVTIWATQLSMASKSLLPPPSKWEGLSDVELRYRQRYVDLWANPQVMRLMKLRVAIVDEIRKYMRNKGFLEVETPMMQPLAGGAAARPFVTHHNALDIPLYLRIAPELYLKRLLVGGFSKVFELNRNFRNEGISPRHNPEFTMLEAYEAYGSWETMADLVEGMICHLAETLLGTLKIAHRRGAEGAEGPLVGEPEKVIDLTRPWRRVSMVDLVHERTGWKFDKRPLHDVDPSSGSSLATVDMLLPALLEKYTRVPKPELRALTADDPSTATQVLRDLCFAEAIQLARHMAGLSPAEQLQEIYEKLIEPTLINPTFVTHVPSVIIPLARESRDDPYFADVYELAINGQEISPGYSELNDPDVQARHFAHQVGEKEEQQKTDDDFLNALRYGMPPAGGMGMGIDRLVMMLTGAESIRDVILFPLMKPVGNS